MPSNTLAIFMRNPWAAEESAALAEQFRKHELALAERRQQIAELEGKSTALAQSVRAAIHARQRDEVVLWQDQMPVLEATKEFTAPPNRHQDDTDRDPIDARTMRTALKAAARKAVAEAKEPPQPGDCKLSSRATRNAIIRCVGAIKLTPAECISMENRHLSQIATAIGTLTLWFNEFMKLYEKRITRQLSGNDVALAIADVPLASPADLCAISMRKQVVEQLSLPLFTREIAEQREGTTGGR